MFRPKLIDTLRHYSSSQLVGDLMAGLIVGIVALPLAIAFGIASGVSPEKGLITAIIAGFLISALGGSRVQIGGPTGAFIVIVFGIVQHYGVNGLIIATFIAGLMLIAMGLARLGTVIQFIPYPLIVGFTSGIALVIFSSQIKDLFGLNLATVPADFILKWKAYGTQIRSTNPYALLIALLTVLTILFWPRINRRMPGSIIAILGTAVLVQLFHLPVETIGSRFGRFSASFPAPSIPNLHLGTIREMIQPAFTIALLGGIESLLSAIVADGMTSGSHRSNTELIAQGTANLASALFGGIPATGAIARTATNIKNGGRTPIAGMTHAVVLLLILLFFGKWAALIPMATLAGILVVVAYNMSEWENFLSILKGPKSDVAVLLITFLLTVLVDLTVAIEIGLILAALLFLRKIIQTSEVKLWTEPDKEAIAQNGLPRNMEVFEVKGPLFFGAVLKFKEAIKQIERPPKIIIFRMQEVPLVDATGLRVLKEIHRDLHRRGIKMILSEVTQPEILKSLKDSRLLFAIGKANVTPTFEQALQRSQQIIAIKSPHSGNHEKRTQGRF